MPLAPFAQTIVAIAAAHKADTVNHTRSSNGKAFGNPGGSLPRITDNNVIASAIAASVDHWCNGRSLPLSKQSNAQMTAEISAVFSGLLTIRLPTQDPVCLPKTQTAAVSAVPWQDGRNRAPSAKPLAAGLRRRPGPAFHPNCHSVDTRGIVAELSPARVHARAGAGQTRPFRATKASAKVPLKRGQRMAGRTRPGGQGDHAARPTCDWPRLDAGAAVPGDHEPQRRNGCLLSPKGWLVAPFESGLPPESRIG